jgi:Zn ribbon nucleic-acid-binding protein
MTCPNCGAKDKIGHWLGSHWALYQCYSCNESWFEEIKNERKVDPCNPALASDSSTRMGNERRST